MLYYARMMSNPLRLAYLLPRSRMIAVDTGWQILLGSRMMHPLLLDTSLVITAGGLLLLGIMAVDYLAGLRQRRKQKS
jgi:hypothetical protein